MRIPRLLLGLALCAASAAADGQPVLKSPGPATPSGPPQSRTQYGPLYGTTTVVWQKLTAPEFDPDTSSTTYTSTWVPESAGYHYRRWVTGGYPHVLASPHLPSGANVTSIKFAYCDTNASANHLAINLYDCDAFGDCNATPVFSFDSGSFAVCPATDAYSGFFSYTVDNVGHQLLIDVKFPATDGSLQLASVALGYTLQVSPAPGSPTFNDVPVSDPGFQYIEALVSSGITAGCGGGNYCPDNPLTRRQMAVFLSKALGLNWAQ